MCWADAMLDEGVYGLRFDLLPSEGDAGAGLSACGDGLAVLRGGQILGSDRYGGVFKGCYRYDAVRGEALVEVRLAVPPNGVLLTGLEAGPEGAFVDVSGRFQPPRPVSSAVVDVSGVPMAVELRFVGPLKR
ncbi:MAG: hypothetical protein JNN24_11930 [Hyphomicrobium zavarzinii]|uniref:hypothetical protein n=2 Tax=Hyphomicrobiaceae TaxID=45401 RepID=UPI001A436D6C|nr:hypothetical protein [Hyphomicrobium zavarzinii]MBL8846469.1 hypothetical protein [Hyphomicrobium zavarzinii]